MYTASDSMQRPVNKTRWCRTCINILLYAHRARHGSCRLRCAEAIITHRFHREDSPSQTSAIASNGHPFSHASRVPCIYNTDIVCPF